MSPAFLYLSPDIPSISGAFTAPAAAEAVILAAVGITSRFIHADQGEPTRRERGNGTMQLAGPNVFGSLPRRAELWERFGLPANPRGATTHWSPRCRAGSPDGKPRHHLVENPKRRRAV